ncbi:MAG: hypothetical protein AABZ18_03330 [Pseudomonadota bacterium]
MSRPHVLRVGIARELNELNSSIGIGIYFVNMENMECHFLLPLKSDDCFVLPLVISFQVSAK